MAADEPFIFKTVRAETSSPDALERPKAASQRGRVHSNPAYSRLNSLVAIYVAASAIFTPVPVALARPQLWMAWVALTALISLVYLVLGARFDRDRPLLSARHPWLFGLALLIPIYALFQSLPGLGGLVAGPPIPEALSPDTISILPGASQMGALRFTGYILFALLAIEVASRPDRARRIGWWIFWGVVCHAIWALVALNLFGDIHIWGADKSDYVGSATGTFINRNSFATFLGMGATLGIGLLYERLDNPMTRKARVRTSLTSDRLDVVLVIVGLGLIGITLLSTQSRMGVFASGIGAVTCFMVMRAKAGVSLWRILLSTAVTGTLVLVLLLAVYGQDLLWRSVFVQSNAEFRSTGYGFIFGLIGERPLLGFGFDAFRPAFEIVHVQPMNADKIWDRAHSTYLAHWSELGLIVGSIPIILGILIAKRLFEVIRNRERDYGLSVAALASLVVAAIHSTVDFSLEMPANVALLLAILGLGIAHRQARQKQS